jgi:hypothetical protein
MWPAIADRKFGYALNISRHSVAQLNGPYARDNVEILRDQVLNGRPSWISTKIVGPALRVLNKVFDDILKEITQVV